MTVKELERELSKFPNDLEVVFDIDGEDVFFSQTFLMREEEEPSFKCGINLKREAE